MEVGAETADQDRHDQRAARQPQFDRLRDVEQRNRAEQHAEGDADEDRDEVRFAQFLHRIAQQVGHLCDRLLRADDHHAVAHLQLHALIRNQIHAGAVDAGDVDAVFGAQVQVGEFLAVDRRFGDEDAPRYELAVERSPLFEGHVDDVTQKGGDGVGILRRADDQQLVADMQAAVLRGDGDMVVGVGDPRNDERAVDKLLHLAHRPAVEYGVGELNRYFVGVFLVFVAHRRQRLVLLLETDA